MGLLLPARRPLNSRLPKIHAPNQWGALEGDSRMASDTVGSAAASMTLGSTTWAQAATGYRCLFDYNGSQGGTTTADMLSRLSALLSSTHLGSTVVALDDINDYGVILSGGIGQSGTTIDNWYQWLSGVVGAGHPVILPDGLPNDGWEGNGPAIANAFQTLNWKRDPINGPMGLFPGMVKVYPFFDFARNPATQISYNPLFGPVAGKHMFLYGKYQVGLGPYASAVKEAWDGFPRLVNLPVSASDTYDATLNPGGCLNSSFMMTGSATNGNGWGQQPTNWTWTSSATGLTIAVSIGTDPDGYGQAILDVTGTPTSSNPVVQLAGLPVSSSKMSAGDLVCGQARVIIDPGAQGLCAWGTGLGISYAFSETPTSTADIYWGDPFDYQLLGQPVEITTPVPSNIKPQFQAIMLNGSPVDFTVRISRFGVRKIFI